jgi:hypothetical protein
MVGPSSPSLRLPFPRPHPFLIGPLSDMATSPLSLYLPLVLHLHFHRFSRSRPLFLFFQARVRSHPGSCNLRRIGGTFTSQLQTLLGKRGGQLARSYSCSSMALLLEPSHPALSPNARPCSATVPRRRSLLHAVLEASLSA